MGRVGSQHGAARLSLSAKFAYSQREADDVNRRFVAFELNNILAHAANALSAGYASCTLSLMDWQAAFA